MSVQSNARAKTDTLVYTAWINAGSREETKELKQGWLTEDDMSKAYH